MSRCSHETHQAAPKGTLPRSIVLQRICPRCLYSAGTEVLTLDELAREVALKILAEQNPMLRPTKEPAVDPTLRGPIFQNLRATRKRTIYCHSVEDAVKLMSHGIGWAFSTPEERQAFRNGELGIEIIADTGSVDWMESIFVAREPRGSR